MNQLDSLFDGQHRLAEGLVLLGQLMGYQLYVWHVHLEDLPSSQV